MREDFIPLWIYRRTQIEIVVLDDAKKPHFFLIRMPDLDLERRDIWP